MSPFADVGFVNVPKSNVNNPSDILLLELERVTVLFPILTTVVPAETTLDLTIWPIPMSGDVVPIPVIVVEPIPIVPILSEIASLNIFSVPNIPVVFAPPTFNVNVLPIPLNSSDISS